jgi:hypothetical protein
MGWDIVDSDELTICGDVGEDEEMNELRVLTPIEALDASVLGRLRRRGGFAGCHVVRCRGIRRIGIGLAPRQYTLPRVVFVS